MNPFNEKCSQCRFAVAVADSRVRRIVGATTGERVREVRESMGISQSALAREITAAGYKVHAQNIQQLEAGQVNNPRYMHVLATVLNVQSHDLMSNQMTISIAVDPQQYICKRFPPRSGEQPSVKPNDWCGEFKGAH